MSNSTKFFLNKFAMNLTHFFYSKTKKVIPTQLELVNKIKYFCHEQYFNVG